MLFEVGHNILKTTVIHLYIMYTIQWTLAKYIYAPNPGEFSCDVLTHADVKFGESSMPISAKVLIRTYGPHRILKLCNLKFSRHE